MGEKELEAAGIYNLLRRWTVKESKEMGSTWIGLCILFCLRDGQVAVCLDADVETLMRQARRGKCRCAGLA